MNTKLALSIVLVAFAIGVAAENWAVIVAGSNYYYNYRHQTDCCHAFQILVKNGVKPENIITMLFNDIASDQENPFPGKLFNKPTEQGTPGVDVYAGCQVDYNGTDVTAENFLKILAGNESAMQGIGNGKVLKSTSEDNVFINFVDHGASGLVAFPTGPYLYATDLIDTLKYMHERNMYKKLVFYLEACESGSMFEDLLPADWNIYATTASNAEESSWGTYCPPDDFVDGVEMNSCLGDLYSVNWMEDADNDTDMKETLQQQFENVVKLTTESHVMQYGNMDYTSDPIGDFEGEEGSHKKRVLHRKRQPAKRKSSDVMAYDIKMHSLYYKYLRTPVSDVAARTSSMKRLQQELQHRIETDALFHTLARSVVPEHKVHEMLFGKGGKPIRCGTCCKSLNEALRVSCGQYSDYGMQYSRSIVNLCARAESSNDIFATAKLISHVQKFCSAK